VASEDTIAERHVKLFRNGRNQAVRIPREFELPGDEAIMRREGRRLVIEPAPPRSSWLSWRRCNRSRRTSRRSRSYHSSRSISERALPPRYEHPVGCRPSSQGRVAQRIARVGDAQVCTSINRRRRAALRRRPAWLRPLVGAARHGARALDVLPFEAPADATYRHAARLLEQAGQPIGPNDLLIAAQALTLA